MFVSKDRKISVDWHFKFVRISQSSLVLPKQITWNIKNSLGEYKFGLLCTKFHLNEFVFSEFD